MDFRASSILRRANAEGLDADGESQGKGDHVVRGRHVFRSGSNLGCVVGVACTPSGKQMAALVFNILVVGNTRQQLEKRHRRLCESAPRARLLEHSEKTSAEYKIET